LLQADAAKRHGAGGVLAAPLMDPSRVDELSPSGSISAVLPAAATTTSADLAAAAGPSPGGGPPTARLVALGPSRPLMAPDLGRLFTLYYYDQTATAGRTPPPPPADQAPAKPANPS